MFESYSVKLYKGDGEAVITAGSNRYRITMSDFEKSNIAEGDSVDEEGVLFLEEASSKLACIKKAFVYLSYRSLPVKKLKSKLKAAGFGEQAIDSTVELLTRKGYLDDYELCTEWAKTLQKSKLYGFARLRKELFAKGFDMECISSALENISEEIADSQVDNALNELLSKKFPCLSPDDKEGRAKAVSFLYRMGYSYDDINNAISALERG